VVDGLTDGKAIDESYYQEKIRYIKNFKKVILICLHGANKTIRKN